ncbi:hypothetical protein CSUI_009775 [Cystoisospora suis]|uniref:Uncharacterized protein n=1 Tax=Cystoisospora suis TaxID=483139 RepID=A0A2C6KJ40_9APIC|nr:hypothetical protein CSUI_009775 [Cystoisospora suis]
MGNTESAPPALHDNYLAVIASIEGRLGHLPARNSHAPTKSPRRANGVCHHSSGPAAAVLPRDGPKCPVPDNSEISGTQSPGTGGLDSTGTSESSPRRNSGTIVPQERRGKPPLTGDPGQVEGLGEGQGSHVQGGDRDLAATESDWEDATVNDFAEEEVTSLSSSAHFKPQSKQSSVKAPSPRLFPSTSALKLSSDSDDGRGEEADSAFHTRDDERNGMATEEPEKEKECREDTSAAQIDSSLSSCTGGQIVEEGNDKQAAVTGDSSESKPNPDMVAKLSETKVGRSLSSKKSTNSLAGTSTTRPSKSPAPGQPRSRGPGRNVPEPLRAEELEYAVTTASVCSRRGFCAEDRRRRTSGASSTQEKRPVSAVDLDSFSPYSPSYALGITTPTTNATTTTGSTEDRGSSRGGFETEGDRLGSDRLIFGDEGNHFPFLEEPALSLWVTFLLGKSLAACMAVCPHWFMKIDKAVSRMCAPITRDFAQAYSSHLEVWGSAVKLQPLQISEDDGVRVDWIIFAKVLPRCAGNVLEVGYTYSYLPEQAPAPVPLAGGDSGDRKGRKRRNRKGPSETGPPTRFEEGVILSPSGRPCPSHTPKLTFTCSYAFAVSPANGSRTLWIHRDMCRFHGDETGVAVMGSIARVCAGDFVEVAVSIYSGGGRVALDRVSWLPLRQEKRRQSLPSKGLFSPEACPLEWSTAEWFPADEFRLMSTERVKDPEDFGPYLRHFRTEFSGMDVAIRKSTYQAAAPGSLGVNACRCWGFPCEVLPAGVPIVCPLTRRGLQHDRFLSVQLRVGDIVEFYMSQGGAAV